MTTPADRAGIAVRSLRRFATTVARHGMPRLLLSFTGGIGDHLLCTAVLRELRRRGGRGLWMSSNYTELFAHNHDLDAVVPVDGHVSRLARLAGAQPIEPRYADYNPAEDRDELLVNAHFITIMCAQAGIRGEVTLQPYLALTKAEQAAGQLATRQITVQSSGLAARFPMHNKEWFPERMQVVVNALRQHATIIQIGAASDPPLVGTLDMRGRTSLRETAALMYGSLTFIGLAGMQMHLARAVGRRSVIVYGGREQPSQSGYLCNENLYNPVPCAPCWKKNQCPFERRCMREIQPEAVIEAALRAIARRDEPLVEEKAMV